MATTKLAIKKRIKSVESTLQITKAMELVATSKLQRHKNRMLSGKEYADTLFAAIKNILSGTNEDEPTIESPFLVRNNAEKKLTIIFGADSGLCGAYNINLFKFVEANVNKDDYIIACGNKLIAWCEKNNYALYKYYPEFEKCDVLETNKIANEAIELYNQGKISSIQVVYTEYLSAASYKPSMASLLPIDASSIKEEKTRLEVIYDPNPTEIINQLIPMYIRNLLYSYMLRSKTTEQAARRFAMENATDNANELKDGLILEFNKARQAAITQELTELSAHELNKEA